MGDMFSKKQQSTTNTTLNNQIGQQGSGQLGVSGSQLQNVSISVNDPEFVTESLKQMGTAVNTVALTSLAAVSGSHNTVIAALDTVKQTQFRSMDSIDKAVEGSNRVALTATPVSPGAYAEVMAGQAAQSSTDQKKFMIAGAVIVAALALYSRKS